MLRPSEVNPKRLGYYRDRKILQAIYDYRALNTEHVHALLFNNMIYGQRKAQERLLKLTRQGKLNRSRAGEDPYIYYSGDRPGMLDHLIGINWIRIWLQQNLSSWETLHSWSYEQDYKVLRADGFAAVKNSATGKFKFTFVEMDRGTNKFNKAELYNKLFAKNSYTSWWWVPLTQRFPPVLIVTVSESRNRIVQSELEAHNSCGLEFQIKLLDEIKKEVMDKCLPSHGQKD